MVHRTDIAGRNSGQISPGNGGLCPPHIEWRPSRKPISHSDDKTYGCRSPSGSAGPCHPFQTPDPM